MRDYIASEYNEARKGNPKAQLQIAKALISGTDAPKNIEEGKKWLMKAVEKRHVPALALLAEINAGEARTAEQTEEAYEMALEAAEAGDTKAQMVLGSLANRNGDGEPAKNAAGEKLLTRTEGYKWLCIAAAMSPSALLASDCRDEMRKMEEIMEEGEIKAGRESATIWWDMKMKERARTIKRKKMAGIAIFAIIFAAFLGAFLAASATT